MKNRLPSEKGITRLIPLILGVLGGYAVFYGTQWGPWAYSDSTAYIDAARNLIGGVGFGHLTPSGRFEYVGGHPPLYQLTLAMAGAIGFDIIDAARWINIMLFGLLILIVGLSIYRISRSAWISSMICLEVSSARSIE